MPKGVCDPSPDSTNVLSLAVLDGNVTDRAVSVMLPNARKAAGKVYTAQPGLDTTLTARGTFKSLGYDTVRDLDDLTIVEV